MRGNAALVPIGFAVFFGVMNGYAIFQPLVVEDRLKTLQERGAKEAVPPDASLQKKSEAVGAANINEREKKDLRKSREDIKPVS